MEEIDFEVITPNGQIYDFIKAYTDEKGDVKFCLYENRNTKVKQCFHLLDLKYFRRWRKNTTKVVETR